MQRRFEQRDSVLSVLVTLNRLKCCTSMSSAGLQADSMDSGCGEISLGALLPPCWVLVLDSVNS